MRREISCYATNWPTGTKAIKKAQKAGDLPAYDSPAIEIGRPKEAAHGDYTTLSRHAVG